MNNLVSHPYCSVCGKQLVPKIKVIGYDIHTGKEETRYEAICKPASDFNLFKSTHYVVLEYFGDKWNIILDDDF